jgi:hypothetical protein
MMMMMMNMQSCYFSKFIQRERNHFISYPITFLLSALVTLEMGSFKTVFCDDISLLFIVIKMEFSLFVVTTQANILASYLCLGFIMTVIHCFLL